MSKVIYVPPMFRREEIVDKVTSKGNGKLDRDAYMLGKNDGIRDCINHLRQQGLIVEEYDSERHE